MRALVFAGLFLAATAALADIDVQPLDFPDEAGESGIDEHWKCGGPGCGAPAAIQGDCNLSLTADVDSSTGTIQLDNLPAQNAKFEVIGLERVWGWPLGAVEHLFMIGTDRVGLYFRSAADGEASPDGSFWCHMPWIP